VRHTTSPVKHYQTAAAVTLTINRYVWKLKNASGTIIRGGFNVNMDAITTRELKIAVQPGTTQAQWLEIDRAIQEAKALHNIDVEVIIAR
jgi:hydroxypyruvate isomerase